MKPGERGEEEEKKKRGNQKICLYFSSRTRVKRFLLDLGEMLGKEEEEKKGVVVTVVSEECTPSGEKGELMEDLFGKIQSPVFLIGEK